MLYIGSGNVLLNTYICYLTTLCGCWHCTVVHKQNELFVYFVSLLCHLCGSWLCILRVGRYTRQTMQTKYIQCWQSCPGTAVLSNTSQHRCSCMSVFGTKCKYSESCQVDCYTCSSSISAISKLMVEVCCVCFHCYSFSGWLMRWQCTVPNTSVRLPAIQTSGIWGWRRQICKRDILQTLV